MFEQLNDQLLVNSLDRYRCEFFQITKNHGPKIHPQGVIWVPINRSLVKKRNDDLAVQCSIKMSMDNPTKVLLTKEKRS